MNNTLCILSMVYQLEVCVIRTTVCFLILPLAEQIVLLSQFFSINIARLKTVLFLIKQCKHFNWVIKKDNRTFVFNVSEPEQSLMTTSSSGVRLVMWRLLFSNRFISNENRHPVSFHSLPTNTLSLLDKADNIFAIYLIDLLRIICMSAC